MSSPKARRYKVQIFYSHKDLKWLNRLQIHLKPLERDGLVEHWDDTLIKPGSTWRGEIRNALESAKVVVLLISADFLASDFIVRDELPPLLAAAEAEGVIILPVILSPSRFQSAPSLAQFQTVNSPVKPLIGLSEGDQERIWVKLTESIESALTSYQQGTGLSSERPAYSIDATGFEEMMRQFARIQEQIAEIQVAQSHTLSGGRRVFVVHGHDDAAKEMVARFLQQLGFEPIILHEQPNEGRAVIEKFEVYAEVDFAVVILTPDDVGHPADKKSDVQPRARQNVIFELGFFIARLGRSRVCALCKSDVEIPSDYHGVLYVNLDQGQGWKMILAREMKRAGLDVDLNRAI